jgi:hypothetical protein
MQSRYAFFIQLKALPTWLRLSRDRRRQVADASLGAALARCPSVSVRHFDAEAFCAPCSDLMMVETADPQAHYAFMEHLRDSVLLTEPYFEVLAVVSSIEDGHRVFEQDVGQSMLSST